MQERIQQDEAKLQKNVDQIKADKTDTHEAKIKEIEEKIRKRKEEHEAKKKKEPKTGFDKLLELQQEMEGDSKNIELE